MVRKIFLPLILGSFLFSILHHTRSVMIPSIIPMVLKRMPFLKAFHSGRSDIHIPRANSTPLAVPLSMQPNYSFAFDPPFSLNQQLYFYYNYSIMFLFKQDNQQFCNECWNNGEKYECKE